MYRFTSGLVYMFTHMLVPYCFDYYSSIEVNSDIRKCESSNCVLFKIVLAIQGSLQFHMNSSQFFHFCNLYHFNKYFLKKFRFNSINNYLIEGWFYLILPTWYCFLKAWLRQFMFYKRQVVLIIEICSNSILESYYYHFTVQLVSS